MADRETIIETRSGGGGAVGVIAGIAVQVVVEVVAIDGVVTAIAARRPSAAAG